MTDKKIYANKNGNLTTKELVQLIDSKQYDIYLRQFSSVFKKCPPIELLPLNTDCFRCISCWASCVEQIKEYKDHYKIKNKTKILKEELDG